MYILPLFWTMLHILNQVYPLCALPDYDYVYQPKHIRITFIFVYTNAISWDKFSSVDFHVSNLFVSTDSKYRNC
jgi:hypothetical protein